ncbi:hypothetical protein HMPREF1544_11901 [Mucor circinelloides 1006PhL]|uniref:Protein CSF1 n=1 Tax=Mucor circinelloides f. circinelloides (strain 1006PhL) TaxID=1220926 RepID=S2JFV7_MUCC1|nr:hypothetical protein HMPREF1544_11901 [Mucor circinelloides 1006PhL]
MFFVEAAAATANNSNLQSVSDFWLFVVYCLVVIVVVIFFLFYFNRVLGQVLTFIINQYTWRRYNAYIEVDSIRVSLLGGRILFKNLRYLSTNQSISIVKGHVAIRYWLMNVRKAEDDKNGKTNNLPCRVVCSVEGLEWFFYNNAPAYDRMKDILGISPMDTSNTDQQEKKLADISSGGGTMDPESQSPIHVDNSLMERLMPIQFECTTGAVMIGNTEIKSMLVWKVSQASGIYSLSRARSSMDYYKSVMDFILRKVQISLKDNMDYTKVDETTERVIKPLPRITFIAWLLKPFRCLYPFAMTRQYGEMQHMRNIMRDGRSQMGSDGDNTTFHEEYARVTNVVECNEMALTYYADYAGPVPETSDPFVGIGIDIGNGGLPPEWGIRISLWDATIHYGAWADRQRSEMQDYFFPNSHRGNTPTPKLVPGQQRIATSFETYIEFMNEGKLRVPTREKSKDWKYNSGSSDLDIGSDGYYSRPYGWLNIKAGKGSFIKVVTPFAVGENGYANVIDVVLKDTDITTSVNYASFIQSNRIEIHINMPTPLQWNGFRHWDFKFTPKKPTIFLLRDHIYLLQDTIKDWTSGPPADLLHFTPMTYQLQFNLENPTIYLCVNEHNVINNPNSIEDNAFLKLQAHRLAFDVILPFTEFQPDTTAIKFFVEAEHGSAGLSLQTSHTLSAFMRQDDAHAAVAVNLTIDGSYEFYSTVDILRHIESCNLHLKINGATVKLFGTLIRYLFLLKENYFGAWNNFSTIDEYRRQKRNQQEWLEQKKKQAESKPLADPFEVYLLLELEDGVLLFPENLYECSRYSQFEFQELQLELRNLDVYLDMYLNISPITLSRDSNPNPQSKEGFFRIKNARDPKNYVYIDGLNVYGHRLFGPLPECSTYLCHWEFDIGRITGEIKPSFLLGLSCFGQSFAYNLIDEDNAVPQEMESKDLPDVTFVKLYVQQVDVCLMSMNSATNIALKDGILLEFDNLINAKYSQRITIKIPAILTRCLANPDQARGDGAAAVENNEYSWVEIAKADLGLNVTIFRHTAMWKKARSEQQHFIKTQDYPTRRCVRLYEEADAASQTSRSSMRSTNEHHVGILYAPPFRPFMFGRVEDKSVLHDSSSYTSGAPSPESVRFAGYSSNGSINTPSDGLMQSESDDDDEGDRSDFEFDDDDDDDDDDMYDKYSIRSGLSVKDNESFHTAKNSDDEEEDSFSIGDQYSIHSRDYGSDMTSEDDDDYTSSLDQTQHGIKRTAEKNLKAAIPPSIPYSDYLRRFKVIRPNSEFKHGGFFHPFIPPSQPHFVPEKGKDENYRPLYETTDKDDESYDYFAQETEDKKHSDNNLDNADAYGKGNEVIATTVIEATRPVTVLVTPILVKLVQELAEEIIKDDWDLETMLDALQMQYIEQLTRYLTDQYICTRFAVILPQTYLHFIQNVTVPDDLPSYKHGESFVKTQYNPQDTILCSADIFLNDFRMIGSVKFEDYAFDEKKKKVAESNMVLQESRVHIDVGDMGSTVQYVSKQYERQSIAFGIPYDSLRNKKLYTNMDDQDEDDDEDEALVDELVMLDLAVKGFSFKWLGARTPNYAELTVSSVDTIIITESVEILVGAVYSWLVFVDDLKGILESFQDQRTRQVQVFINEIANYSITQGVVGDPVFLTTPTTMLRLGSRNFRNDCGWKLLARMRHCLRSMPSSRREELQYRLTSGGALQGIDSEAMYANVVHTFSHWRSWEVGYSDITHCRLFTQPFHQNVAASQDGERGAPFAKNMTDEVVRFLISSANFAKIRLGKFMFTIYEEETSESSREENSISIGPFEFLLECLFKASPIASVPEHRPAPLASKSLTVPDGYLDIITKISLGEINISTNPIILAFARHMLLVQKVFTAKLLSLSHANKTNHAEFAAQVATSSTSPDTVVVENNEFDFDALLGKVDVVAQALVNLDKIQVIAHAHELRMDTLISGVQGSALFSNPKLAPLQLFSHTERDSDTGSGRKSSNRGRKNAHAEPRLVLEAAGGINVIDIQFREELQQQPATTTSAAPSNSNNVLLGILFEKANVNANISQVPKVSKKHSKSDMIKNVLNVFSNIHKFHIHVPQSLLRLYGFVESWQTEQGRRYHFMFQNLVKEWEDQRGIQSTSTTPALVEDAPANPVPAKKMDIKLQFLLNEFAVQADLLPSLSFEYSILDFFIMVNETHHKTAPVHMYAFQLSKQVIHLITKDKHSSNSSTFSIPGIRSTGSIKNELVKGVSQMKLRSMISIDLIAMSLDASLIDSLLTAQSLVGNEVSELVEVLSYSKTKSTTTTAAAAAAEAKEPVVSSSTNRVFKYSIDISLDGLQVSASSPSALGMFRSNLLEASISNDDDHQETTTAAVDQLSWKLQARNFSLSLDHNTVQDIDQALTSNKEDTVYQRNCLAYILVDFSVQNYLPTCTTAHCQKGTHAHACDGNTPTGAIFIDFSRIQTVMQPIALGKLAEMYIYYDAELGKKKRMKKAEIDQLSANTKRIVQSISSKNEWPKALLQEEPQSLLENKTICLHVRRLGVAIPLNSQSDLPSSSSSSSSEHTRGVSALLLSVVSIEFMTKNIEKGALQLDNLAVQFVKRFDQNKADHFIAENHPRMNQVSLPSISCHVSATKVKPLQSIKVDAHVKGFEIDVDGTIADYINTLSIIYVKSKDRVDAFTNKANFNLSKTTTPELESPHTSEVVHLDLECKFECDSGTIRMYPKRHSSDAHRNKKKLKTLRIRTGFDPKNSNNSEGNMATVELPGLSAWLIYQTPLGAHAKVIDAPKRFHADILIRESVNTLHPALVQFLREVTAGLKLGIQQSSERKADRPATSEHESNLNASLFLRLSKTQLDLSCQPTSKVVCSLGWQESEFMMNAFSKDTTSRTISCVGSVREITAMVKHHFSPEACLHARIDRILFNVMLTSQREGGDLKDDISIIIELPHILGDLNMRHLQDLLILNTCWFAQQPVDTAMTKSPKSPSSAIDLNKTIEKPTSASDNEDTAASAAAPFSKHVAVCVQSIRFSVDLGQNIGKITLMPNALSFQLHHVPHETKGLSLSLDEIKVISEGRLSGKAEFSRAVVQGRVDQSVEHGRIKEKSSICVRSDGFSAAFEYEYQNILDAIQQSLELNVDLQRTLDIYDLQVSINLDALIARLSVKTVPVIITMVQRFNELLKKKRAEAGIRSDEYDTTMVPPNDVVVMAAVPKKEAKQTKVLYENSSVRSQVNLCIKAVEIVIYPSQFQDSDNVDIRAKQFKVDLEVLPRNADGVHRKLLITLTSAALAKNVPGKELMVRYSAPLAPPPPGSKPKNLGGTKIFGIPGTEISMESTQLNRHITHEFGANFAGRISVSLNIGLIKYLQEMINMFNMQLDRALEKDKPPHLTPEPSTPLSVSSSTHNFEDIDDPINSKRKLSSMSVASNTMTPVIQAQPEDTPPEAPAAEKYTYVSVNSVSFQPQLQVMGDATPPVEWLGLKRERIPGLVHENITLHLDQVVKVIWGVLESQAD